jgi:REP element-mobilizing transposase RayT
MSGPLRVEYPGAIYHIMCRSNAGQRIFHNEADYQRLVDGLALTVSRFGWELFSFVLMPNHFHLFLRTPQPKWDRESFCAGAGRATKEGQAPRRLGASPRFAAASRCFLGLT